MTADEMLDRMATLMQYPDRDGLWHARRIGKSEFHHGATADEAMRKALGITGQLPDPPAAPDEDLFGEDIPNADLF